ILLLSFLSLSPRTPPPPLFPYTTLFRSISASTACCGVSKLRVPTVEAAGVADGLSMGDCCAAKGAANRKAEAAVQPSQRYFEIRSEEHTSELQSRFDLVCRLLLEKKKKK